MKILRIGLHGFVLVVADLAGIAIGAVVAFRVLGVANQVWFQVPVAVGLSVGLARRRAPTVTGGRAARRRHGGNRS